jgi:hypothetical protein
MGTNTEDLCMRSRDDCTTIANISADDGGSFVCCGYNKKESRSVGSDRFTLCWKNDVVDERGHWDRRDLLDTQSVIAQALSVDENIRVNEGLTDAEMNEVDLC